MSVMVNLTVSRTTIIFSHHVAVTAMGQFWISAWRPSTVPGIQNTSFAHSAAVSSVRKASTRRTANRIAERTTSLCLLQSARAVVCPSQRTTFRRWACNGIPSALSVGIACSRSKAARFMTTRDSHTVRLIITPSEARFVLAATNPSRAVASRPCFASTTQNISYAHFVWNNSTKAPSRKKMTNLTAMIVSKNSIARGTDVQTMRNRLVATKNPRTMFTSWTTCTSV